MAFLRSASTVTGHSFIKEEEKKKRRDDPGEKK